MSLAGALVATGSALALSGSAVAATAVITSVKFAAPVHDSYDHATGGGAWNSGSTTYVKGELQGTNYRCGDIATFMAQLNVAATPTLTAPYTAELVVEFTWDSTGASGVSLTPLTAPEHLRVNSGVIAPPGVGTGVGGSDGGFAPSTLTPPAVVATTPAPTVTGNGKAEFTSGATQTLTFSVENLQKATSTVVRMDTRIGCQPGARPTGNMQASLKTVTVSGATGGTESAGSGNQTVNFRGVGNIAGASSPVLALVKTVSPDGATCPGEPSLTITAAQTVRYCYAVTNYGTVDAAGVTLRDDLATPTDPADDVDVALTNSDGATSASGVAVKAGTVATGFLDVPISSGGTYVNTAVASATNASSVTDTATVDARFGPLPELTVEKRQLSSAPAKLGDTIVYEIVATNTGNLSLASVSLSDPNAEITGCTPALPLTTLAVSGYVVCTAEHVVTASDLVAGHVVNTAIASSTQTGDVPSNELVTVIDSSAILSVTKQQTSVNPLRAGETIRYQIIARNIGSTTLTGVVISDPAATLGDCAPAAPATLAPGEQLVCDASVDVTQADVDAGAYVNHASGDADHIATVASNEVVTPLPQHPSLSVVKRQTGIDPDALDDIISYEITATNTGNLTLTGVAISDEGATITGCSPVGEGEPPVVALAPGDSLVCQATRTVTSGDVTAGQVTNTAQATSNETGVRGSNDIVSPLIIAGTADVAITKQETSSGPYRLGDSITYLIVVTNVGEVPLEAIGVSDAGATVTCPNPLLDLQPGDTVTCDATHVITAEDLANPSYTNTATFSSLQIENAPSNEVVTDLPVFPALAIFKRQLSATVTELGSAITYALTVLNTGNTSLVDVGVSDPIATLEECSPEVPVAELASGSTIECIAGHLVTQENLAAGFVDNTAFASDAESSAAGSSNTVRTLFTFVRPPQPGPEPGPEPGPGPGPAPDPENGGLARTGTSGIEIPLGFAAAILLGAGLLLGAATVRRRFEGRRSA